MSTAKFLIWENEKADRNESHKKYELNIGVSLNTKLPSDPRINRICFGYLSGIPMCLYDTQNILVIPFCEANLDLNTLDPMKN